VIHAVPQADPHGRRCYHAQWDSMFSASSPLIGVLMALALGAAGCAGETAPAPVPTSTMVFVDQAAAPGGDGSSERPFRTMREAFEVGRPIEAVAVAAGRYPAPASWTFSSPLTILAYGVEPTTLEAEPPASQLGWSLAAKLVLRDLELGSPLALQGGQPELYQVAFAPVSGPALTMTGATSRIFGLDVTSVLAPADDPSAGDGVVVEGGALTWTGGSVLDVPDRALVLSGVDAELDSLMLGSVSRAPLTVSSGADVTARGIQIDDVRIAVFVEAASLQLEQATVSRASTAGVLASAQSTTQILGSTFTDCANGHVTVQGNQASMTIQDSTLRGATLGPCVFASNTDGTVVVRHNTVQTCAGSGISLFYVTDALVEDNEVLDVGPDPIFPELADGISVQDGAAQVRANRIHDTLGYGIALNRAQVLAEDNHIGPTGAAGVAIVDPGEGPCTISTNTIEQATSTGVIVLAAEAQVLSNTITGTAYELADSLGDGVAFGQGANVTVQGNTLNDNARNGVVFMDGAQGTITDNVATGNSGYGILELCVGAANAVVVGDNVLDGNSLGPSSLCSP
jgi:parallel beta-helix repeat protein